MSQSRQPAENLEALSIAILAGGQSRRMGTPKALLRLSPDGPTLIELVASAVRPLADDLFIVGGDRSLATVTGLRLHDDHYPDAGPLGGICTALDVSASPRCLVVSCDMPFLSRPVLGMMRSTDFTGDALIPVTPGSSRQGGAFAYQTLHAIYRRECIHPIRAAITAGNLQTISWFRHAEIDILPVGRVRELDDELLTFFSVNTPEALARARTIVASRGVVDPVAEN